MPALSFAIEALSALPDLIAAGVNVVEFIGAANTALKTMQSEDRDPTDAEWEALNQAVETLRAQRPDVTQDN